MQQYCVSFVLQGHTHEDIDARFSRVSKQLKHNHAKTIPELMKVIAGSLHDETVRPMIFSKLYDVRAWISPYLNEIHNHTLPHVYRYVSSNLTI